MPKLPAPLADQAREAAASGGSFLLEPGVYVGRLAKVEATKSKSSNNPMWALEFDDIHDLDGNKKPGKQFTNLTLIDNSMWKVGLFFAAFGVPEDTDADDLVGHRCRLQIGTRVMTAGQRAGQEGNDVNGFIALQDGDDGYAALVKLQARIGKPAATKAAAPKAAAKAVEETTSATAANAEAAAPAAEGAPDDVDF